MPRASIRPFILVAAAALVPPLPLLAAAADLAAAANLSAPAPSAWLQSATIQRQLDAGRVVDRSAIDERHSSATIDAAIRIHASPQAVWPIITQCRTAALLMPQLKRCRLLRSAADGSWAIMEHEIKYSFFSPTVRSVFRADFHAPYRMDFHRIAGDLKGEVGSWTLTPSADGSTTTVEYRLTVQPGFWVPRALVRHSLSKELPAALVALRTRAEESSMTPPVAAAAARGDATSAVGADAAASDAAAPTPQ